MGTRRYNKLLWILPLLLLAGGYLSQFARTERTAPRLTEAKLAETISGEQIGQVKGYLNEGPDGCQTLECAHASWVHKNQISPAEKRRMKAERQQREAEIDAVAKVGLCARDPNYC